MTTYEVLISEELLEQIRADGSRLPAGFRVGEVTAHPVRYGGEPPSFRSCYVRVEDDFAPAALEGLLVSPVFREEYDDDWQWVRTVIARRDVEDRATVGYVLGEHGREITRKPSPDHLPPPTD